MSYDLYTRTTTLNHHAVVQELFLGVHANGYFVEQTTYGAISPSTGRIPCPTATSRAPARSAGTTARAATSATTAATS